MRRLMPVIVAFAFALAASPALACTCACNISQLIESTPTFFVGKPVSQKHTGTRFHYEVEVVSVIKGELPKRVVVVTPSGGGACSVHYTMGEEVLIGVRKSGEGLTTNLCVDLCARRHRGEIEKLKAR